MKTFIILLVLSFCFLSCNSKEVHEGEKNKLTDHTLIPQKEYLTVPDELGQKIMSYKLIEQMSVKNYLYKNNEINEDELSQKVILYFETEPTEDQKNQLKDQSAECYWELWTPPADNHPYGFITARLPITKFEDILYLDFIKKVDTGERELQPSLLEKVNKLSK